MADQDVAIICNKVRVVGEKRLALVGHQGKYDGLVHILRRDDAGQQSQHQELREHAARYHSTCWPSITVNGSGRERLDQAKPWLVMITL